MSEEYVTPDDHIDAVWEAWEALRSQWAARGPCYGYTDELMQQIMHGLEAILGKEFTKPWHPRYVRANPSPPGEDHE